MVQRNSSHRSSKKKMTVWLAVLLSFAVVLNGETVNEATRVSTALQTPGCSIDIDAGAIEALLHHGIVDPIQNVLRNAAAASCTPPPRATGAGVRNGCDVLRSMQADAVPALLGKVAVGHWLNFPQLYPVTGDRLRSLCEPLLRCARDGYGCEDRAEAVGQLSVIDSKGCDTGSAAWNTVSERTRLDLAGLLTWLDLTCGFHREELGLTNILASALDARDAEMVQILLTAGADPAARTVGPGGWIINSDTAGSQNTSTPLHIAAARCDPKSFGLLLQRAAANIEGVETLLAATDPFDRTPAQLACPQVRSVLNEWLSGQGSSTLAQLDGCSGFPDKQQNHHPSVVPMPPMPAFWLNLQNHSTRNETDWSKMPQSDFKEIEQWMLTLTKLRDAKKDMPDWIHVSIVDAADMTPERFNKGYLSTQKPLIVRGAWSDVASAAGAADDAAPSGARAWSPAVLESKLGGVLAIVSKQPNAGNLGISEDNMKLSDYLQQNMPLKDSPVASTLPNERAAPESVSHTVARKSVVAMADVLAEPQYCRMYAFEGSSTNKAEEMYRFLAPPAFAQLANQVQFSHEPVLHLGPRMSGSPPHFHPDTLNGGIVGRKLWVIFPPQYTLFSSDSAMGWFLDGSFMHALGVLPRDQQPAVFWTEAGDVVYIPGGLSHAVLNFEDNLGLVIEMQMWRNDE